MLKASDAAKLQAAYGGKYQHIIEQAENIVEKRPAWLNKKITKIECKIKKAVANDENSLFYPIACMLAWGFTKRLAIAIVLAQKGYYISFDSDAYISWSFRFGGYIKAGKYLKYEDGQWNVESRNIIGFYKVLLNKKGE